jgi:hypothetical protein
MKIKITKFFLFFLLINSNSAFSQFSVNIYLKNPVTKPDSDTIFYDTARKLIWDDFKGEAVLTGNVGAITSSGFGYKAGMRSEEDKAYLNITVHCFFIKSRSWVKPQKKTPYVLNHEQHHFDIAYIGAGLFKKKLNETELTKDNYRKMIKQIYSDTYSFMYKLQDQYDTETKNGQSEEKQTEWDKKIAGLIKEVK